jgi:hypothetical protein
MKALKRNSKELVCMKKSKYIIGLTFLLLIKIGACSMGESESDLAALLPRAVGDWRVTEPDQSYDRENLYTYIDGGAELYLSYGFKKVINRKYSDPGQPQIVVDLFDMGTSQNAFGVFSYSREVVDNTFGQGSQHTEGSLLFWKSHYFVSILASPETIESKKAIFDLAEQIDGAIAEEGSLPEILTYLPQQSLVEESIRYFHHYIWLNSHYYIADWNILHIDDKTDAVLAKYGEPEERHILLLVKYLADKDAKIAFDDFAVNYLPELSRDRVIQIEDGTWTGCQLNGNLLIIVFSASTEGRAIRLIEAVQESIAHSGKSSNPKEEPE